MTRISDSIFDRNQEESTEIILFYNDSGVLIPAGSMMEVDGVNGDDVFKVKKPTGDDLENVIINGDVDVPITGFGQGWESGTHSVVFDGAAPVATERIGSQTGSWNAKKSDSGTHLVRAISGSIAYAFPFKAAAAINRVFADEFCYVKSNDANAAFGHPDTAIIQTIGAVTQRWYGVFKFEKQLPASLFGADRAIVYFADQPDGLEISDWAANVTVWLYAIQEDFDASTLTYNQYMALTTQAASEVICDEVRDDVVKAPVNPPNMGGWTFTLAPIAGLGGIQRFDGAYGFGVHIDVWFSGAGNISRLLTSRAAMGSGFSAFFEWF